ncbi:hypothetical protein WJX81_006130 [Elliptochloris bilobata]|uniref:Trichome birefringence-like N-terminal domain-containing protein n=1 Tax=Elliptochloris bilobata TaxID=381761 RepID=A0AAW1REL9_9CHLO
MAAQAAEAAGESPALAKPRAAGGTLGTLLHGVRLALLCAAAFAAVATVWAIARAKRCGDSRQGACGQRFSLDTSHLASTPAWFNDTCPLRFDRIPYEDLQNGSRPYLFGGVQRPQCTNCHIDTLWANFCQYKNSGPVCYDWDIDGLSREFVARAEAGNVGARELLDMTPCDLFSFIRGRTLWLIGDSIQQEYMRAMQCFVYEWWDMDIKHMDRYFPQATLEGLLGGWCVEMPESTKICHLRSNMGDWLVDTLLPRLPALGARRQDIIVLNFAVWINWAQTYREQIAYFAAYHRKHRQELPFIVWRDSSVQHFDTPTGDYECDGCPKAERPFNCHAIDNVTLAADGTLSTTDPVTQVIVEGGWRNKIALPAMHSLGIPVMNTWNSSATLWSYHYNYKGGEDCTHSCHPSAYQTWIYDLVVVLRANLHRLPSPYQPSPAPAPAPAAIAQGAHSAGGDVEEAALENRDNARDARGAAAQGEDTPRGSVEKASSDARDSGAMGSASRLESIAVVHLIQLVVQLTAA